MTKEKEERLCLLCKDPFTPARASQKYCKKDHKAICAVCNKEFTIKKLNAPSKTCSSSCASSLSHSAKSKETRKQRSLEKYGTEHPLQANEVKEKIQKSLDASENDKRFGSKKFQDTMLEKYGVINSSQMEEVKEKKKNTMLKNYGVENPMQSKEIRDKRDVLFKERYGVELTKELGVKNLDKWRNLKSFIETEESKSMSIEDMAEYFGVNRKKMIRECTEQGVIYLVHNYGKIKSFKEEDLVEFMKKNFPDVFYKRNDRTILNGKELDFYFPEQNLAVEISPTRTHNTLIGFHYSEGKEPRYHKDKFLECSNQGIELLTIFDWHDWDKIMDMLTHKLKKTSKKIFARTLSYEEYEMLDKDTFEKLSSWHILSLPQNFKRKNTVGLLKDKNGMALGIALWTPTKTNNEVELKRMVFKPGFQVVGGVSKLIANYESKHDINSIMTFSDCDLGQGNAYSKNGFELIEESKPSLNYYHEYYKEHITHISLVTQGADRLLSNFPKYKPVGQGDNLPSNMEILLSYGFLPVYDCGYRKWRKKV